MRKSNKKGKSLKQQGVPMRNDYEKKKEKANVCTYLLQHVLNQTRKFEV